MLTGRFRLSRERLAIASLALLALVIWAAVLRNRPETLTAVFLDVGQGDCIFLRTPSGRTILVDGGGRSDDPKTDIIGPRVVEPFLRREGVNKLDLVVLTHPHEDHVQGLISVVRDFRVGMVLDSGILHGSQAYQDLLRTIQKRRIPYHRAMRGQVIDFGDGVRAQVLNPGQTRLVGTEDDTNNNSIVLRITYGKYAILLTGDIGKEAETDILVSGAIITSDVLKVCHHGSLTGTTDQWLDAAKPKTAVISVGRNSFGHPSEEVEKRLSARGIKVYRTDRDGAITLTISASNLSVKTSLKRG